MDIQQPTFMLLPSFRFLPDREVQLGTLLTNGSDTKRPDPSRPLNRAGRLQIESENIETSDSRPWSWDSNNHISARLGVFAEIGLFTGIGGSARGSRARDRRLLIHCDHVRTTRFSPNSAYIANTLKDGNVQPYLNGSMFRRPALYMVTGIMVAHNANIEIMEYKKRGFDANLTVDGTQAFVPIKAGPQGGYSTENSSRLAEVPAQPFVLAYELRRIKLKRSGGFTEQDENEWALFTDDNNDDEREDEDALINAYEIDDVSPGTNWEDR